MSEPLTEGEIRAAEQILVSALVRRDLTVLERLFAPDYVFTSAIGETWSRARALADCADPDCRVAQITVDVETVVCSGETCEATGTSDVSGRTGERDLSGRFRFSHTWRRRKGGWELVAGHTWS